MTERQMTKVITNKQFVSEVARIMNKGQHFEGADISKDVLLEKLKKVYMPEPCKECGAEPNHHTLDCTIGGLGGSHPCM